MIRRAFVSFALAAAANAETASSGVANVLPVSAALSARGALQARVKARLHPPRDRKNGFRSVMSHLFEEVFIVMTNEIFGSSSQFTGGPRRHRPRDYRRHHH